MRLAVFAVAAACFALPALAAPEDFKPGPLIEGFGPIAAVPSAPPLSPSMLFRVAFDDSVAAEPGKLNRTLESAARFLNMHIAAGVPEAHISVAVVVHGPAAADLLATEGNANAPLIAELIAHGVRIELCGQTAAAKDISAEDLLPGVEMALSAMTAHALLQQDGYTLNPF